MTIMSCRVEIRERVHFAEGAAEVGEAPIELLDDVARVLLDDEHLDLYVQLVGHRTADEAAALGGARAQAVREALLARGVPAERLAVRDAGDEQPLLPADDPNADATNRRTEFVVVPRPSDLPDGACFGADGFTAPGAAAPPTELCVRRTCSDGQWLVVRAEGCDLQRSVAFAEHSAEVAPAEVLRIDTLAAAMLEAQDVTLRLIGRREAAEPQTLAQRRAEAVAEALRARGVAAERLTVDHDAEAGRSVTFLPED